MLDSYLTTVQPTVLRDQVAAALRAAIFSGALQPGTRLVEAEIASRSGVSKAPVREAFRLLEAEGLVVSNPHRGSFVVRLSAADVQEIFSVRSALERLAVGMLVGRCDSALTAELRGAVEEMRISEGRGDVARLKEADVLFHRLIVSHAGSSRTARLWSDMLGLIRLVLAQKKISDNGQAIVADRHDAILEAIERGDREGAQSLMEQHLLRSGVKLAKQIAGLETPGKQGD
jgi:DNA-binding GntR family transcriptional regulator